MTGFYDWRIDKIQFRKRLTKKSCPTQKVQKIAGLLKLVTILTHSTWCNLLHKKIWNYAEKR